MHPFWFLADFHCALLRICLYMAPIMPLSVFCVILLLGRLRSAPPMTRLFYLIPCRLPNDALLLCYRSQITNNTDYLRTKEMPTTKRLYTRTVSSNNDERSVLSISSSWINLPDRLVTSKRIAQVFKNRINTDRSIVEYFNSTSAPFSTCRAPNFSL